MQAKHILVLGCKSIRLTQKLAIRCRIYIAEMCGMLNFRKLLQKNLLFTPHPAGTVLGDIVTESISGQTVIVIRAPW